MSFDPLDTVRAIFSETAHAHQRFASQGLPGIVAAAAAVSRALDAGRKVLAFGNGGSASDAEHLIAELVGGFEVGRASLGGGALASE
jgi:D-sedoheptulose 7-phosphate isomerase